MRAGESAAVSVVAPGVGVPQRVGKSGAAGDDSDDAGSAICTTELRVRGGKTGVLEGAWNNVFGAGARTGTTGEMFPDSGGFGTRSASRIKRKSRPNS